MIVQTSLGALASGQKIELSPGDILRISISFKYTVAESTTVVLWASLGLGIGRDIENREEISLEAAITPKTWEGSIDLTVPQGVTAGTYWLRAEVEGYPETQVTIPDAVEIIAPPSIWESMSALMVMGLMMGMVSMMMPMMKEGFS